MTDAVRLFADRARAAQSSFRLDAQTQPAVVDICRRLEGIPLAIEFAAARISHLSPAQVAERLGDRFRLLTGGRRRIARQQTLTAALDWSHELLSAPEQVLFRRLAVFAGGFSLDAAEGVCPDDATGRREVLDRLGSLVAKSLVTAGDNELGETRYRLLETVRLYALDKLDAAGETGRLRSRHRDHYLGWLEAMPMTSLVYEDRTIDAVGREVDNLRAAADWCLAEDRPDLLVRVVTCMDGFWLLGNSYQAPLQMLERALQEESRLSIDEQVAGHAVLAWLCVLAADLPAALHHSTRSVERAGDRVGVFSVLALSLRAFSLSACGSIPGADPAMALEARVVAGRAVERARTELPAVCQAEAELMAGIVEMHAGDLEAASHWFSISADTIANVRTETWLAWAVLSAQASARHLVGQVAAGLEPAFRLLSLHKASEHRWPLADTWLVDIVPALFDGGHATEAERLLRHCATRMRRSGVGLATDHFLCIAGAVEFLRGRPERAGRLLGAARGPGAADSQAIRFRTPAALALYLHYKPLVRAALGPEQARTARDEGRAMTLDEAFDYALAGLPAAEA